MQKVFNKEGEVVIYTDTREMCTRVISILEQRCTLREKQLEVADYLLSDNVAVERKTTDDFANSIIDRRLFVQLANMKACFQSPILMIEGKSIMNIDINIHPNALRGAVASACIDYGVPIIWTENQKETAEMLLTIARREQLENKNSISVRGKRRMINDSEKQLFIVSGMEGISGVRAKSLLKHFKTPEKIFTAPESELMKVDGIGKETARNIRDILTRKYKDCD